MNKKFLWLLLLAPVFLIAATTPFTNYNDCPQEDLPCVSNAELHNNWNGNNGCPYVGDFSSTINCDWDYIDVNPATSQVDHSFCDQHACIYHIGNGVIEMLPEPGYTGAGFVYTANVKVIMSDGTTETAKWTFFVDSYSGPYAPDCY
jgi:hypothetical protein